jgi:hypothetical protein
MGDGTTQISAIKLFHKLTVIELDEKNFENAKYRFTMLFNQGRITGLMNGAGIYLNMIRRMGNSKRKILERDVHFERGQELLRIYKHSKFSVKKVE